MKPENLMHELETMIDRFGLTFVLQTVQTICEGKAEHLESNWQDKEAARLWLKAASALDRALVKAAIVS